MAPHEQRLRDQRLQSSMRLLGDAVFMRAARRDPARAHPVVLEHGAKARRDNLGRLDELTAWARPHGFELAFVNTATALSFPGAEVAARLGIPTVWAIHESFEPAILWAGFDPGVREPRAKRRSPPAAFAVFEAEATQRIFEPLIGGRRCRTLPYGLDLAPIAAKRTELRPAAARREAGRARPTPRSSSASARSSRARRRSRWPRPSS